MLIENKQYEIYDKDPYGLRVYTLDNGLKIYLSQNFDEPRIKTRIAVRAGATSDPGDATGLAHYVEHMMFKGTDLIGALNREKEASIIGKIKSRYEELAQAESPEEIIRINSEIDNLSSAASLEAIPGELDKLYSIMGCRNTNARTGFEETVYENDIPSVELERWICLEKERFTSPVLRLFPPELEVVYEEFNQAQDDDVSRAYDKFLSTLFPRHPYGRAGILGKGDHLKKPSMEKIEDFLKRWYIPSNMAIILTGALDFDATFNLIKKHWGTIPKADIPVKNPIIEESLKKPSFSTIYGQDSPFVLLGYRFKGFGSEDELYLTLIDMIMSNNQAGLLDLNLVQKQKVLEAESSLEVYKDYSWFTLYGVPLGNQSLKKVLNYLLEEIEALKRGDFEKWYNDAVITCFEVDKLGDIESGNCIEGFVDAFITGLSWDNYLRRIDQLKKITFEDLIGFIQRKIKDNYRVVFKKKGSARDIFQIDKPNLTPVVLNREVESEFCSNFKSVVVERNSPHFADLASLASLNIAHKSSLYYEVNSKNELFELMVVSDYGRFDDLKIHYGAEYRDFIGTETFSPKEFQQEFFKRGLDLVISSREDTTQIILSGRSRDMDYGIDLLNQFINQGEAFKGSYRKFIKRIGLLRKNAKSNKRLILWGAMYNQVHYGSDNPFRYYLTLRELRQIGSLQLIESIKKIFNRELEFYYYGPEDKGRVLESIKPLTNKSGDKVQFKRKEFKLLKSNRSRFLFVNYDMVQSELLLTGLGVKFNKSLLPLVFLFNEYFGGGMDSVVFQEVRERRGLAYTAYANYSLPKDKDGHFIFNFYVGTQGDKTLDALRCILGLLEFFPKAVNYFEAVKASIIKNIESDAVLKKNYYFIKKESLKYGLDTEMREYVYSEIKKLNIDDLEIFFNRYIKNLKLNLLLLGNKKNLSIKELERIMKIKCERVKLKSVFGY